MSKMTSLGAQLLAPLIGLGYAIWLIVRHSPRQTGRRKTIAPVLSWLLLVSLLAGIAWDVVHMTRA